MVCHFPAVYVYVIYDYPVPVWVWSVCCCLRGGKDFFVIVFEKLMFVKGTGKHWCKYPHSLNLVELFCVL